MPQYGMKRTNAVLLTRLFIPNIASMKIEGVYKLFGFAEFIIDNITFLPKTVHISMHRDGRLRMACPHCNRSMTENKKVIRIKGERYNILRNSENLKPEQRVSLQSLLDLNENINRAYMLKEAFRRFWDYRHFG